jgi:hypothetical protein
VGVSFFKLVVLAPPRFVFEKVFAFAVGFAAVFAFEYSHRGDAVLHAAPFFQGVVFVIRRLARVGPAILT